MNLRLKLFEDDRVGQIYPVIQLKVKHWQDRGRGDENPKEILSLQFAKELQEFDGIGFFVSRDGKAFEHAGTQ